MVFVIKHPIITQLATRWDRQWCAEPQPCKPRYFHQVLSSWAPACPSLPFKHSLSQRAFCLLFPQHSLPSLPRRLREPPRIDTGLLKDLRIKQELLPAPDSPDRRTQSVNYLSVCHGWTEKGRTVRGGVGGGGGGALLGGAVLVLKFWIRCPKSPVEWWAVQRVKKTRGQGFESLNSDRRGGHEAHHHHPKRTGRNTPPHSLSERTERTQWPSHQLPSAGANKLHTVNQGWNPSARKAKERLFFWEGPRMLPASESAFQAYVRKAGSSVPATEGKNMYLLYIVGLLQKLFISQNHSAK